MLTACFGGIGTTDSAIDLTDIKVNLGENAGSIFGDVYIQLLDEAGVTGPIYCYNDLEGEFDAGWYTEDAEPISKGDVVLPVGQGLWTTAIEGVSFTYAGQVIDTDVEIQLRDGATACGNMMAVPVDLTDVLVSGYEAGTVFGDIYVQILDNAGVTGPIYCYNDLEGEFDAGWYTEDAEPIAPGEVTLEAGLGLWVTAMDGVTLTFPAPELNK